MKTFYVIAALICTMLLASLSASGQTPQQRKDQEAQAKTRHAEFKKRARTLVPSKADRAPYAEFLKSPNTGLIRLLPREKYIYESYGETMGVSPLPAAPTSFQRKMSEDAPGAGLPGANVSGAIGPGGDNSLSRTMPSLTNLNDLPRINPATGRNRGRARDGGAYYSFALRTHAYGYGSDLSLERGMFNAESAGAGYAFLTNLGDVPLESVTLDTPEAKLMDEYVRARKEPDARTEQRRFMKGVDINGVLFTKRLPMRLHSTYLLRAIDYERSDLLVTFRVVEVDSEGTPLILWKRLKKYSTPPLVRKQLN
jgi:hypothetical protein